MESSNNGAMDWLSNSSSNSNAYNDSGGGWSYWLNAVANPVVFFIGLAGNLLCLAVIFGTHLRHSSTSVYLAYLSVVDSVFLCTLVVNWLTWLDSEISLGNRPGWCQGTVYLSYVSCFLSAWTVVSFTGERWVVVFHPLRRATWCTRRRSVLILASLTLLALALYSYALFTNGVLAHTEDSDEVCQPLHEYMDAVFAMSIVDSVMTFVVPFTLISVINTCIGCKICLTSYNSRQTSGTTRFNALLHSDMVGARGSHDNSKMIKLALRSKTLGTNCDSTAAAVSSKTKNSATRTNSDSLLANANAPNVSNDVSDSATAQRTRSWVFRHTAGGGGGGGGGAAAAASATPPSDAKQHPRASTSSMYASSLSHDLAPGETDTEQTAGRRNSALHTTYSAIELNTTLVIRHSQHQHQAQQHKQKPVHNTMRLKYKLNVNQEARLAQPRATKTLLIISTAFLVQNLPSHVIRLYLIRQVDDVDVTTLLWQHVLQLLAYSNFASNFFFYAALSKSFRCALKQLIKRLRLTCAKLN